MKQTMIACLLFAGLYIHAQPVKTDTTQLRKLIQTGLSSFNLPGLSIAIVKDSGFLFHQGYGRTRSIFGKPVTAQTIFNVASLSKPVAAYTSIRYLFENGLSPDSVIDHPANITYKQLLAHTAGFSNFLRDQKRKLAFAPGTAHSYSGVGYMVLQENITVKAKTSLDSLASNYLFDPAGMSSSYFGKNSKEDGVAPGHIPLLRSLMPFMIPFIPSLVIVWLMAFLIPRIFKRKVSAGSLIPISALVALIAAFLFLFFKGGSSLIAFYFTGLGASALALLLLVISIAKGFLRGSTNPLRSTVLFFIAACYIALLFILRDKPVPINNPVVAQGNAASSLRTNASDMGKFITHLLKRKTEHDTVMEMMITPQIKAGEKDDWGLGFGLRKYNENMYAWHWGSNPGNRAIIVIDFKNNWGFCIMCNSGNGKELLEQLTKFLLEGKDDWNI